jgi:hypothetical protein
MRKLHKAAVVTASLIGRLGAGVATAQPEETPTVTCEQDASRTDFNLEIGGTVAVPPGGGDADASATQQVCGIGNSENENTAGTAVGGAGADVLG